MDSMRDQHENLVQQHINSHAERLKEMKIHFEQRACSSPWSSYRESEQDGVASFKCCGRNRRNGTRT